MQNRMPDPLLYHGKIKKIIEDALSGEKVTPDDWALIQESLPADDPAVSYFRERRKEISSQLVNAGKYSLAAPIFHFTYNNEPYVVLMQNIGLVYATLPEPMQWTAHSTRVDINERQLLNNDAMWQQMVDMSHGDDALPLYFAAIARRAGELGIPFEAVDLANIQPIDRLGAGLPEVNNNYDTRFFYVNLGERNPKEIIACLQRADSRFAEWSYCFKLSELQNIRRNDKFSAGNKDSIEMIFEYKGKDYPLRYTTWSFIKALQLLHRHKLNKEGLEKNPWEMSDVSPEGAISWVQNRLDADVQITLFHEKNSRLSSPVVHAFAARSGKDPEDIAYYALRPERLVLQSIIANLLVKTVVQDGKDFDSRVWLLFHQFHNNYPGLYERWERQYAELTLDTEEDQSRIRALTDKIDQMADKYIETGLYCINESSAEIATILVRHEKFHHMILPEIKTLVAATVDDYVAAEKLQVMPCYELSERQCFAVTGPVASGKSTSEERARALLGGKHAIFISSDEWYELLTANQNLEGFTMQRGKIALAEAWRVKELTWELLRNLEKEGHAPNWIQEACNPASIAAPAKAQTTIFINTSNPDRAVDRVKKRGDKSGRYVAGFATITSYRFPWVHFIAAIKRNLNNPLVTIHIVDTDILFSAGKTDTAIATVTNGVLQIKNLNRFLSFIERFYRINEKPTGDAELLSANQPGKPTLLIREIAKLFDSGFKLEIIYKGKVLTRDELENMAVHRYKIAGLFKVKLAEKRTQHDLSGLQDKKHYK